MCVCVWGLVWWGRYMARGRARFLALKYRNAIGRTGSVCATLSFISLIRAIEAQTASHRSWFVPQTFSAGSCPLTWAVSGSWGFKT